MNRNTRNKILELDEDQCELVFGGTTGSKQERLENSCLNISGLEDVDMAPDRPKPRIVTS